MEVAAVLIKLKQALRPSVLRRRFSHAIKSMEFKAGFKMVCFALVITLPTFFAAAYGGELIVLAHETEPVIISADSVQVSPIYDTTESIPLPEAPTVATEISLGIRSLFEAVGEPVLGRYVLIPMRTEVLSAAIQSAVNQGAAIQSAANQIAAEQSTELQIAAKQDAQIQYAAAQETETAGTTIRNAEINDGRKIAYLTFDDGPSRAVTPLILDLLSEEGINATFFVLPFQGVDDLYRRIINEGHELGNHTYSHVYSRIYRSGIDAFRDEVVSAGEFIYENFGYETTLFRFPGGSMSWSSDLIIPRRQIVAELGYRSFDWHIDSGDTRPNSSDRSAERIVGNVLDNTRGRSHIIVLMHDSSGRQTTLEALPYIIAGLREQGYSFDVLSNYPGSLP